MDEERAMSIVRGREGWDSEYSSISEFKEHSNGGALADEKLEYGWVLWHDSNLTLTSQIQQNIITFLKSMGSTWNRYLIQFWAVVKVEGRHHYLSTTHQPCYVGTLGRGSGWYRKECMNRVYRVDVEGADDDQQQLGGVGRAYRNKHPESTPDLRLYSTHEFPLRDHAARCGFTQYLALPLFHLHHQNPCYGVMELLTTYASASEQFATLDARLQIAGLRSTHINFIPVSLDRNNMSHKYMQQADSEISEILEVSIKAVPRLSLAQFWVPCKQCVSLTTNLCCMERASFINSQDRIVSKCGKTDVYMFQYLQASEFHNLQIDLSRFGRDLCNTDVSISKNPLAHYAERARLSLSFAIYLQRVNNNSNHFYVIEFFLQPKYGEDACVGSSLHLILIRIMEMKLRSYKIALVGQLPEEFVDQSRQPPIAIGFESIDMLNSMASYTEILSDSNFTKYLEIVDLCCSQPSNEGWLVCRSGLPMKDKIVHFFKEIAGKIGEKYCMVQFWAPKIVGDRQCLDVSDQPYAVGYLAKGLASFRKECMKHHYFVGEEAKEEELGPPGRVFRNGHPELFHDPFFYSAKEFSMRSYALHCGLKNYFVLPVFDQHKQFNKQECVGVLEFLGFSSSDEEYELRDIRRALQAAKLHSTQIHSHPTLIEANIHDGKVEAMNEIESVLTWFGEIPQCQMANVWVPNAKCMGSKSWCMKWVASTTLTSEPPLIDKRIHVELGMGITGILLQSESKSCFCRNICEFSIAGQPLVYHQRAQRLHACFAICLQSSHTGDLLYVLEFFLYRSLATYEYLRSFLYILLPIMKHFLKSFKIASGKQLGEELVVEVIEFSEANQLISSGSNQLDVFPIKFKSVIYGQKEHQHIEEQMVQSNPKFTQRKTEKGKRKTGLHLSLEVLKPHFGKKLEGVAEELGIGRSTIKRACRDYGITRWPGNEKQARNPSLFERASTQDHHQDMQPSSSNNLQVSDVPNTNTESTQILVVQEEAEKVMIKVKYQGNIIRFESRLSLGVVKLSEEVARRLNLEAGTFKLKYMDEDNEEILIGCDEDLQLCPKSLTSMGNTCVQLFIPK